ncbi:MAG: hypothetical protein Q3971_09575 [Moraxella sp.]|nr:hypothetical protein [Moraxella sp.]
MSKYSNTEYSKRAKANYRAKSLKQMSLNFSHNEQAIYDDLQALTAHYGTASGAIKAAIVAHAKTIKGE